MTYVELHAHSAYSFLDGASQPEELAARAAELGYESLALTDHDGVYGSRAPSDATASTSSCNARMSAATSAATRTCATSPPRSVSARSRRATSTHTTVVALRSRTCSSPSAAAPRSRAASRRGAAITSP